MTNSTVHVHMQIYNIFPSMEHFFTVIESLLKAFNYSYHWKRYFFNWFIKEYMTAWCCFIIMSLVVALLLSAGVVDIGAGKGSLSLRMKKTQLKSAT